MNNQKNNILLYSQVIAIVALLQLLSSCYSLKIPAQMYNPPTNNTALLAKKGEVQLNTKYTRSGHTPNVSGEISAIRSLEIQGAAAVTNKLGLIANANFAKHSKVYDIHQYYNLWDGNYYTEQFTRKHHYFDVELGAGRYWGNLTKNKNYCRLELYGGLGFGKAVVQAQLDRQFGANMINYDVFGKHNSAYQKLFLQTNFGFVHPNVEVGTTLKASLLRHQLTATTIDGTHYNGRTDYQWLLMPSYFLRVGKDPIKLSMELSPLINFGKVDYHLNEVYFTLGLQVRLQRKKKKRAST